MPKKIRSLEERLLESRFITESGCWEWTKALTDKGYGAMGVKTESGQWRMQMVHRVAYSIWVGDPEGQCVLHHCDNPKCFNPEHLWLGTQQENMADMLKKGRQFSRFRDIEYCQRGHNDWYVNPNTGKRCCRPCLRLNEKKYYDEQRPYALKKRTFKRTPKLEEE